MFLQGNPTLTYEMLTLVEGQDLILMVPGIDAHSTSAGDRTLSVGLVQRLGLHLVAGRDAIVARVAGERGCALALALRTRARNTKLELDLG